MAAPGRSHCDSIRPFAGQLAVFRSPPDKSRNRLNRYAISEAYLWSPPAGPLCPFRGMRPQRFRLREAFASQQIRTKNKGRPTVEPDPMVRMGKDRSASRFQPEIPCRDGFPSAPSAAPAPADPAGPAGPRGSTVTPGALLRLLCRATSQRAGAPLLTTGTASARAQTHFTGRKPGMGGTRPYHPTRPPGLKPARRSRLAPLPVSASLGRCEERQQFSRSASFFVSSGSHFCIVFCVPAQGKP